MSDSGNNQPFVGPAEEADAFDAWIKQGIASSWIGPPVCDTHDGTPMSADEEEERYEDDGEPCIHILRLYVSAAHRADIEQHHSPSVWRRGDLGLPTDTVTVVT